MRVTKETNGAMMETTIVDVNMMVVIVVVLKSKRIIALYVLARNEPPRFIC